MSRTRTRFVCQKCGGEAPRWLGRCPECGEWNSLLEETAPERAAAPPRGLSSGPTGSAPQPIASVSMESWNRTSSGLSELDRVLGGGVVPGSLVLIGGDPGIGKSTLLMQASGRLAAAGGRTLYVTGEESVQQVKLRADRLGSAAENGGSGSGAGPGSADELYLLAETDIESVEAHTSRLQPRFLVIDSIQTVY